MTNATLCMIPTDWGAWNNLSCASSPALGLFGVYRLPFLPSTLQQRNEETPLSDSFA